MYQSSSAVLDAPVEVVAIAPGPPPSAAKKPHLPALTGLRAFAALNLVFFHFANPRDFGWLAPVVDNGYTSVSFFLLLSGFILAYNYSDRSARGEMAIGKFWVARFSRLYPVYIFSFGHASERLPATEFHQIRLTLFCNIIFGNLRRFVAESVPVRLLGFGVDYDHRRCPA